MSHFSEAETTYLQSQRLGRLATVDDKGQPHVIPVGFHFNPDLEVIDIGGRWMAGSKKWRDIVGHPLVSFVVDDVLPPWQPRGIEIRGRAEQVTSGGDARPGFAPEFIRVHPARIITWGIETDAYQSKARSVG
jgi:pyridoxamine 5'-phosphate oxidase family protein